MRPQISLERACFPAPHSSFLQIWMENINRLCVRLYERHIARRGSFENLDTLLLPVDYSDTCVLLAVVLYF